MEHDNCVEPCENCTCGDDWTGGFNAQIKAFESKLVKEGWALVGTCDVDSGTVMIGDPCYTMPDEIVWGEKKGEMEIRTTYSKLFDENVDFDNRKGAWEVSHPKAKTAHKGAGVIVSAGYGDGSYPVYVRREAGRIKEARIIFIPEFEKVDY